MCAHARIHDCDWMGVYLEGIEALYSDEAVPQVLLCGGRRPDKRSKCEAIDQDIELSWCEMDEVT